MSKCQKHITAKTKEGAEAKAYVTPYNSLCNKLHNSDNIFLFL